MNMNMKYEYITALSCCLAALHPLGMSAQEDSDKITVEVVADSIETEELVGETTVSAEEIKLQGGGGESINDIAFTMANVQFDDSRGVLDESSILDIRPSQISISGGRTYDNNFVVDGVSSNSLMDTSNTNVHNFNQLVGHPQTVFINPALVERVTVYDSDISAEYGGFGGGVFEVKTKEPSKEFHFGASYGYKSDATTHYKLNPRYAEDEVVKPLYEKKEFSAYTDMPLGEADGVLVSYSRTTSELENTQPHMSFSYLERTSESISENFDLKYKHWFSEDSTLLFSSVYSPYEQENFVQSLKIQKNTGWVNSLQYEYSGVDTYFLAILGYSNSDSGREQEQNSYSYKNTESVYWVSDDRSSGNRGATGILNQEQEDIPFSFKYEREFADGSIFRVGSQFMYQSAFKERPETVYAYGRGLLADNVVSAEGEDDLTVLKGEQALQQRNVYYAYLADVSITSSSIWAEYMKEYETSVGTLGYRIGLRGEHANFLSNTNIAPRLLFHWSPNDWLVFRVGAGRYYVADKIAYKIAEAYPDMYIERRSGTEVGDSLVFSMDDWKLKSHIRPARYSQAGLDTPYSDELSISASVTDDSWGLFKLKFLKREGRDEFSRSYNESIRYDRESGGSLTHRSYKITNGGSSEYRSLSFSWIKDWKNHSVEINSTYSDTETTNVDYFEEYDLEKQIEIVSYGGELMPYYEMDVARDNMADPLYFNFKWNSTWLDDRLSLSLSGRWTVSFDKVLLNGTETIDGERFDLYEDTEIPSDIIMSANARYNVMTSEYGDIHLIAKITNVLDEAHFVDVTSTAPYIQGRTFWLGLDYNF